jgi:hypothetical protein
MNFKIYLLLPITLMIFLSVIPFSVADSTVPSAKSNSENAFTAATFAGKYKDIQFTGERVTVVIKMAGGSSNPDPEKKAKEIRYLHSFTLKFLSYSKAVNVASNPQTNEITAQIDSAWIPILEQRNDVLSITIMNEGHANNKNLDLLPPKKQQFQGREISEINCKESFVLIQKHDKSPACVKPQTVEKLIQRGWTLNMNN